MASPTEHHWQIAISVLRYLKGTPSHGLIFRKQLDNGAPDFIFSVDADWATFMPKRRSTTGYLGLAILTVSSRLEFDDGDAAPNLPLVGAAVSRSSVGDGVGQLRGD
eukprot:jgi/Tetstr1/433080/TSEL_022414.t1